MEGTENSAALRKARLLAIRQRRDEIAAFRSDLGFLIVSSHEDYHTAFEGEYAEAFGRLWLYFLKLQGNWTENLTQNLTLDDWKGCSPWNEPDADLLDVSVCLKVCEVYDPEMSPAGIVEMLCALGMSTVKPQRLTERLFTQWAAVMFAGCDEAAMEEAISCMLEAVMVVLTEALATK